MSHHLMTLNLPVSVDFLVDLGALLERHYHDAKVVCTDRSDVTRIEVGEERSWPTRP